MAAINPQDFPARLEIIGDKNLLENRARLLGKNISVDIRHVPLATAVTPGRLDKTNARYVLQTLDLACHGCLDGEYAAMVTAPIQKDIINDAGIAFSGHTEYLAGLCGVDKPVMLLATDELRVALATTHLPLRNVADAINAADLTQILQIMHRDLMQRFGLRQPHIKVCGLNPHAGENGYLGREEIEIISPVIQQLQSQGLHISGPYPADTIFTPDSLADADAILAMYHDQGLPVLKHAGFNHAINTTLGLPIIRTSVDHGTALHLAGSGKASPQSLLKAIESAIAQYYHRQSSTNPA
jgi:4-hydroxythreonine-4-phosphate dehydrogenase